VIILSGTLCIINMFENKVHRKLSVLKKNGVHEHRWLMHFDNLRYVCASSNALRLRSHNRGR
jgi:hypothetical protein